MRQENGLLKYTGYTLMGLGLFFTVMGVFFIYEAHTATWMETRAIVRKVEIRANVLQPGDQLRRRFFYYPEITYEYAVDDETFTSDKYKFKESHPDFAEREEAIEAGRRYPIGSEITAYYNAKHPSTAVLVPTVNVSDYVALLIGLLFFGTGYALYRIRFLGSPGSA